MTEPFFSRYEYLEDIMEAIDASRSWQFLVANQGDGEFDFTAVSNGSMPLLTVDEFPGIEDMITIKAEEGDSYSKMHIVRFVGDIAGLEMFVDYLTLDLDGRTEGNEDPIGGFAQRNPFWSLAVFGSAKE